MPQTATETLTLKLPSGEDVDAIVPSGMSDQQVHDLMQQKHPEYFTGAPNNGSPQHISQPSAISRFWSGIKAGMGDENALNTKVDPKHPISTNALIPGSGVYRDIKSGNYASAAGRIAGPLAAIGSTVISGGRGIEEPSPAPALLRDAIAADAARTPFPTRYEGLADVEAGQSAARELLGKATAPRNIAKPISKIGDLLNESLGGKSLEPNVPIKNQLNKVTKDINVPSGHTPTESSAISSYKYDPAKQEFEVVTTNGSRYIHGDVSPEQAKAFEEASSKGKAWGELKKNSTYVGKLVNGHRVSAKPPSSIRSASPDDLTPLLEESLKQAKTKSIKGE